MAFTAVPRRASGISCSGDLFVDDFKSPAYDPEFARSCWLRPVTRSKPITYRVRNDYYPNELTVAQFDLDNLRNIGFNIDFSVADNPNDLPLLIV